MKKTIYECMILAMQELINAQAASRLIYPSTFEESKSVEEVNMRLLTDNPLFEMQKGTSGLYTLIYRLRENTSAVLALESLLQGEHYMVIDCKLSIVICQWYALLLYLREQLGVARGNQRFDALFGGSNTLIPHYRRLILCDPVSARNLVKYADKIDLAINPYPNPLCSVIKLDQIQAEQPLSKGLVVYVENHPDYRNKHPYTHIGASFPSEFKGQWCVIKEPAMQTIVGFCTRPIETIPALQMLLCEQFNQPSVYQLDNDYPDITPAELPRTWQTMEFQEPVLAFITHAVITLVIEKIDDDMRPSIESFERRRVAGNERAILTAFQESLVAARAVPNTSQRPAKTARLT